MPNKRSKVISEPFKDGRLGRGFIDPKKMSSIRKISSFKRSRPNLEKVPVLPIHEKYAERHEGHEVDPFDDIIGRSNHFVISESCSFKIEIT